MQTTKPQIQKSKPVYANGFLKYCLFDGKPLLPTDWVEGRTAGTESYQIKCPACKTVYNRFRDESDPKSTGKTYYMRMGEGELYWRCIECDTPAIMARVEVPVYSHSPSKLVNAIKAALSEKDTEYILYCPNCGKEAAPAKLRKANP